MAIDWKDIASQIGGLEPDGREKGLGTEGGRRALEIIIGEQNIRDAVDCWTDQKVGAFAAEMALRIVRPTLALERCYEIYKQEPASNRAGNAIFLLYEMADWRAFHWIPEFLADPNPGIRLNGLMALQQILMENGPLDTEETSTAKALLAKAKSDSDSEVRIRASEIRQRLASNPRLKDF